MEKEYTQNILKDRNGLNFNLKTESEDSITFATLNNYGIDDLGSFMDPKPNVDFTPSDLSNEFNSVYYVEKFAKTIKDNNYKYTILVDNDADGFTSAAFLYQYLKHFTDNIEFMFSEGKSHGLSNSETMTNILKSKVEYLLIPDAGSNDYKQMQLLTDNDIPYLIIDHHDFSNEAFVTDNFMPIISNQYSDNDAINRKFTGVGMVYMVAKKLDELLESNYADELLYYFSVGQVADVSDVSDLEIRSLMLRGFKQINDSPLLKLSVDTEHISPHELSFSIIPKINAVCRGGSIDDKANLMKSLSECVSATEQFELKTRKKSPIDHKFHPIIKQVSFHELELRKLNSIQAKQKRKVNTAMKKLTNIMQNDVFAVVIDDENAVDKEEAGLLAMKFASKFQKPTLVLHPAEDSSYLTGSGRGMPKVVPDFKQYCLDSGKFLWALGHSNAFGAKILKQNLFDLLKDTSIPVYQDTGIVYDVDCLYVNDVPTIDEIKEFDEYRNLFGGRIKDPQLGFVSLNVPASVINFRGNMMSFTKNGISFVMFTAPSELKDIIENNINKNESIVFDVYGTPTINRFMKDELSQIVIEDIKEATPVNDYIKTNTVSDLIDF